MNRKIRTHGFLLEFLLININGNLIALRRKCLMSKTDLIQGETAAEGDDHIRILYEEIPRTAAQYAKMKERGVRFLSEPFQIKTGWAVEFEDPSGNRLGITDYKT